MTYEKIYNDNGIGVSSSLFRGIEGGMSEHHLMFDTKNFRGDFPDRVAALIATAHSFIQEREIIPIFCRWFLSDIANQATAIPEDPFGCAMSVAGQAPLDGSKVSLWIYGVSGRDFRKERKCENYYSLAHGPYSHIWVGDRFKNTGDSEEATVAILTEYDSLLKEMDCTLEGNCIRTWFFVRDVDVNYKGMVVGRNRVFELTGLTPRTHFIASTGIGANTAQGTEKVVFNAYAVKGLHSRQVTYLKAPSHLNATMEYGVAFERGTSVDYGDRRHVIISGTASINKYGEIMHKGDVRLQACRMIENVEKLLETAETSWKNVAHIIVYLRDFSDHDSVKAIFDQKFPDIPTVMVQGPVCRPGWLIEMECMAIKPLICEDFAPF